MEFITSFACADLYGGSFYVFYTLGVFERDDSRD